MKKKIIALILLVTLFFSLLSIIFRYKDDKPELRGFGWYGHLADDEITEESLQKIKELGGNSVNINVYYEYDLDSQSFVSKSNLKKIEEKIDLAHQHGLIVFLSPFSNLVGGHYLANAIETDVEEYLNGAKTISINLAEFSHDNNVEIYAVWNEMGLSLTKIPNSTKIVNEWLQETRKEVVEVYNGFVTTKEGIQRGFYRDYNFSGFDYIGVTFYPAGESKYTDTYTNMTFTGVESLREYEEIIKEEYDSLVELKQKFGNDGVILGEIGIDVVGGNFVGSDEESKKIRAKSYEILLVNEKNKIDGFFFSRFEYEDGGSEELDQIFKKYFSEDF